NTGYFPTESLEPSGNRLFSRSALNEGDLFRGSIVHHVILLVSQPRRKTHQRTARQQAIRLDDTVLRCSVFLPDYNHIAHTR
ncbi:hypothetical protein, partial [Ruthenibacterium lactatiformans]|uniref:hypothetical protein n=1 Tax=Ruthenibacterium lactatiformans TaxID=1550024 RepID=UPI0019683540